MSGMNIEFKCPKCAQVLEVPASYAGQAADCPSCSAKVTIPSATSATLRPTPTVCPGCGAQNVAQSFKCSACGRPLPAVRAPAGDGGLSVIIPYKNGAALAAYYLGVFSAIPCLGSPLGIAALIFGIIGLKKARLNPEARGRGHAWAGIILGALFGVIYTLLIILAAAGFILDRR